MDLFVQTDYEKIFNNILKYSRKYFEENNIKDVVLGVSGGIDSALVAALCYEMKDQVALYGYSLPIESGENEVFRSELVLHAFCRQHEVHSLESCYKPIWLDFLGESRDKDSIYFKIRRGNIKARLRMMYLYNQASVKRGLVLSTDNLTEYHLGFWTLHGDVGDFGMIQQLWKTEVYGLSEYLMDRFKAIGPNLLSTLQVAALDQCIRATPTDGLGITVSDFDQIGVSSYEEADKIIIGRLLHETHPHAYGDSNWQNDHPIVKRMKASNFKRTNPFNIDRSLLLE